MGNLSATFERLSFTARYMTALSLIALLSTLAFFNLNHLISSQANDGQLITTSGQQIMLSQKIALYAIYYQTKQLEKSIEEMEKNHAFLLEVPMSKKLHDVYFNAPITLDEKVKTFLTHAKRFQLTRDGRSLTYVLQNSQILLEQLNQAAQVYLEEAEAKTKNLSRLELYIYIATLVALLLEAIFIFKPANASINRKTEELTQEKNYSNAVIESSTNAIISLDREHRIRTYNRMAEYIFGYKREEMQEINDLLKIIPSQYGDIHAKGFEAFITNRAVHEFGQPGEFEAKNKEGKHFPIRISFGASGQDNVAIVANIQDISQEKLNDTLLHKQAKFAALGEMIAIIAHQWRQPLAELSFNNIYLKKCISDEGLRDELHKNEGIIQFMSETIASFESFYLESPRKLFESKEAILQGVRIVESLFKLRGITLDLNLDDAFKLYGHQNTLAQVILSLLQNAVDIHTSRQILNPWVRIVQESTKEHILIEVRDNGGGIKPEALNRIFDPFYSEKKSPSTGLGLYMSKLVIEEKFGGSIEARNSDLGACFIIILPFKQYDNPVSPPSL
jgi:PAS domain S-box-containing protein